MVAIFFESHQKVFFLIFKHSHHHQGVFSCSYQTCGNTQPKLSKMERETSSKTR
jgi:hypothetical protein